MTIITKPWHMILFALALCYCVTVASYHYSTVSHSRIHADLIRAQYEQAANIEIEKIEAKAAKYYAIAKVWECR